MKKQIVIEALYAALSLLQNEIAAIEYEELKKEYMVVLEKIELALKETTE